ncbi:lmo0937 family membrane protein [Bacillus daqingensis]|uniref:Lmo0937 family membrane protein n=1 Tax=Bacillus daqingensis TaxID=872396 RepID=A0ABV9NYP3_9BACI
MIWTIIGILILAWLLGFSLDFGGGLIHTLLVIALIVAVVNLILGRRA